MELKAISAVAKRRKKKYGIDFDNERDGSLPPAYFATSQIGKDAVLKDEDVFSSKKKHSSSFFLISPTFENFRFWAKTNIIVRAEKLFLKIIPFDTHSTALLLPLEILKKLRIFSFKKTDLFFFENTYNFERFEKFYYFRRILQHFFYVHRLKKSRFFLKNPSFLKKIKKTFNFERFEKSYYFSRILQQFCYLQRFLKKSWCFFEKPIFFQKTQILNVLRNLTTSVEFCGKIATIWWKKIHIQKREQLPMLAWTQLGKHWIQKQQKTFHLRRRFCFPYYK